MTLSDLKKSSGYMLKTKVYEKNRIFTDLSRFSDFRQYFYRKDEVIVCKCVYLKNFAS